MVVDAAMRAGALGARMTGGGFGGCAIALVADGLAPAMVEEVRREALARGFSAPTAMPAVPSAGALRDARAAAPLVSKTALEGRPWPR
jgi:galactokinase